MASRSVSYGQGTPSLPAIDLLKSYCGIEAHDDPRRVRDKALGKVLGLDVALQSILPPIPALLDVPVDDADWLRLDPRQRRRHTLEAVKHLRIRESQAQPVLVVLEELHWIDSETQTLLDRLVESLPTARVLLLVHYRPEYQHGWGSKTYYTQLRLDPLPAASADAFLHALLGDDTSLAPLTPLLIARTQGNPFFLEESVRTLVETGGLTGERGVYRVAQPLDRWQVPATVQAVLAARIVEALEALAGERLVEQVERLAHHALRGEVWDKVLTYGRQAGEKALARSAYREAVGFFEQALGALPHLPETYDTREQAIDLRLALCSALYPSGDWRRILACLHEAEALATARDDPRRLGQVSRFLSDHFRNMGARDQAIAAAQRALALATESENAAIQALANLYLGAFYWARGDYLQAIDCLRQTVVSLHDALRRERLGQVNLPSVRALAFLAACHAELGMTVEGRALGEEGLQIAETVTHPSSLMWTTYGSGLLSLCQGNLPKALPLLERAMSICQDADLLLLFAPRIAAGLGTAYTLAGRVADAVGLLPQAMEQTLLTDMTGFQALCRLPLGEAHMLAGRLEEAYALVERTLALACAQQERSNEAYALRLLGEIAARHQPPEHNQAEASYRRALALAEELGMRPLVAHCHLGLGTLYAKISRWEEARAALSAAIELYGAMAMTFWLPQAEAALAQVEGR